MPIVEPSGISWATEIEEEAEEKDLITQVEYIEEDGKKYKISNVFRLEKIKVPRPVAERKSWAKFGDAANDPPGVNPATTLISDEVFMQFLTKTDDFGKKELAAAGTSNIAQAAVPLVRCRYCKGDHWSTRCPHKDLFEATEATYKPPSMREGAKIETMGRRMEFRDENTIMVTNLPEETTESDLMELFRQFGKMNRITVARDKYTQLPRGFAYISFQNREDAQRAIWAVNGYGYHHLILKVDWANKPSRDQK